MVQAFSRALAQLGDPVFRRVFWRAFGLSLLLFILLGWLAWLGLGWLEAGLADWLARQEAGGTWVGIVEWLLGGAFIVLLLVVSFLLFPAVVAVILSLFLDQVAEAAERRYYPNLPPPRRQPLLEATRGALLFAGITVALNLLALPLYLVLSLLPPLNVFVFYGLNSYLLGREYFELVAVRRLDLGRAREVQRAFRGRIFRAGLVIALLLTIPLVNLITPLIATAFMLHVFERLRRDAAA